MHSNINMFDHLMEHLIFSHMYDTLVITIVNSYCKPKSPTKPLSQIASFTASLASIYFGLVVNKATIECKVTFQLIILPQSSYIPYQRHYSIQISSIVIINITNNCPRDVTTFIITKPTCDIPFKHQRIHFTIFNESFQGDPYIYSQY